MDNINKHVNYSMVGDKINIDALTTSQMQQGDLLIWIVRRVAADGCGWPYDTAHASGYNSLLITSPSPRHS